MSLSLNRMKVLLKEISMKLSLILALCVISIIGNAQTVYFSNQNGMPTGSAQTIGNTTYYSNQNGMPVGSAQTVGNTVYYSNQNGMPAGSAQVIPGPSSQSTITPLAPLTPLGPLGR